jgi:hypothetical protein
MFSDKQASGKSTRPTEHILQSPEHYSKAELVQAGWRLLEINRQLERDFADLKGIIPALTKDIEAGLARLQLAEEA